MINFKLNSNLLRVNHRIGKKQMSKKAKNVLEQSEEIKDQNFLESL